MYYATQTQNDNLLKFIADLENVLPKTVNVLSLTSEADKVSIEMMVESEEAVAKSIQEVRAFECIDTVTVASVKEELNEYGGSMVTFTLECTYTPILSPAEVAAQTAAGDDAEVSNETAEEQEVVE